MVLKGVVHTVAVGQLGAVAQVPIIATSGKRGAHCRIVKAKRPAYSAVMAEGQPTLQYPGQGG